VSDDALRGLAAMAGIELQWRDVFGRQHDTSIDAMRAILTALGLPCGGDADIAASRAVLEQEAAAPPPLAVVEAGMPWPQMLGQPPDGRLWLEGGAVDDVGTHAPQETGYHRIESARGEQVVAVTPRQAFRPDWQGRRPWGLALQLYAARRTGDGGIGDFTSLGDVAECAGRQGADAIAISPVHAQFAADPAHYSPYAPSSRIFLNIFHIDAEGLCREAGVVLEGDEIWQLAELENAPLVNWQAAGRLRVALLRRAFDRLRPRLAEDVSADSFAAYWRQRGADLHRHALFEALHGHFTAMHGAPRSWRDWPTAYRGPDLAEAAAHGEAHFGDVAFHAFLQWQAERGLAQAQARARRAGMRVGLVTDIAVGIDPAGSHCWSEPDLFLPGLSIGAPPDVINPLGQDWGLASFSPRALTRRGYAPFLAMLRSAMRHAGGVRIDHVLGLRRLWLVPRDGGARNGAYLRLPEADLMQLVALESSRQRAIVVGEDLGTVPEGFRDSLRARRIAGTRVLWFEREGQRFLSPHEYEPDALAMTSTHDLATVAGWWTGQDIDWRARLDLLGEGIQRSSVDAERETDRRLLWEAFCHAGVARGDQPPAGVPEPVVDAAAAWLGRTASDLALLPVEDALGLIEQPNLPGTTDQHPNWRRRLPANFADLVAGPVERRLQSLHAGRSQ
jgi:4-alpha-glucanotransferase